MDASSVLLFNKKIDDILSYIDYISASAARLVDVEEEASPLWKFYKRIYDQDNVCGNNRRIIESKAVIIEVYGVLERITSDWISMYLNSLSRIYKLYSDIPKEITAMHNNNSVQLFKEILSGRNKRFSDLKFEDAVLNLSKCLSDDHPFCFNSASYLLGIGNISDARLKKVLGELGINMEKYFSDDYTLGKEISPLINSPSIADLRKSIDELVIMRNDAAHGEYISNILGLSELKRLCENLRIYGGAVFRALDADLMIKTIENKRGVKLKVSKIHYNIHLDLDIVPCQFKAGDLCIISINNSRFFRRKIDSIFCYKKNQKLSSIILRKPSEKRCSVTLDTPLLGPGRLRDVSLYLL